MTPVTTPRTASVATYIASSIDGGNTFSAQVYANPANTATDAITGQTDVLGPEADNATTADNAANCALRLWYLDGSGRVRRPGLSGLGRQFRRGLSSSITSPPAMLCPSTVRPMVIAAGPRIVSSTMGPVAASSTSFIGTLTAGSSSVTGVTSTASLFAGQEYYRHGSPVRRHDRDRQQLNLDHVVGAGDSQRGREPDRSRGRLSTG